jgi:hypothetical protein
MRFYLRMTRTTGINSTMKTQRTTLSSFTTTELLLAVKCLLGVNERRQAMLRVVSIQLFFAGATDFNGAITPNSHLRWQSPLGEAGSIMGSSATYWCACRRVGSEPSGLPESSAGARSAGVHPRRRTALRVSQFLYRPPRQRWLLLLAALQVLLLSRERLEPESPVGCWALESQRLTKGTALNPAAGAGVCQR